MRARCRRGCLDDKGQPQYHDGKWACPKEPGYDAVKAAEKSAKKADALARLRSAARGEGAAASEATPEGSRTGVALSTLEVGTDIAETSRRDLAAGKKADDWKENGLLDADHCETLYEFGLRMTRGFVRFLEDIFKADKTDEGRMPDARFTMNPFDRNASRSGFGQRFATKIVKGLGANTLEEAQETIDSMAFFGMFGELWLDILRHLWRVTEQSPVVAKLRAEAAKNGEGGGWLRRRGRKDEKKDEKGGLGEATRPALPGAGTGAATA